MKTWYMEVPAGDEVEITWLDDEEESVACTTVSRAADSEERAALAKISRIIAGMEPGLYQPDPYKRLKLVQNIALPYGLAAMHGSAPPSSVAGNAARDLVVRVACGLADNAPWRQSPDMDILKDVVSKYRAASPASGAPEEEP